MKRKLSLLMACILIIGTLSACRGNKEKADGKVPTLTWYVNMAKKADADLVEAELNKLIEPKIGAKVDFVFLDAGVYDEKLNMLMASKTEFDLCFSGWVNKYARGVSSKGFLKLNEYLDKAPALKEAIPEYAWKAVNVGNGDIYAVPNLQIYAMWQALYVTKSYADKYGLDVSTVKTPEDLIPFLEKIRDNEPEVYPYTPGLYPWCEYDSTQVLPGNGELRIKNDDANAKVYLAYETEEYKKGVNALRDFYKRGFIRKDIASAANDTTSAKQTVVTQGAYKPGAEADMAQTDRGEVYAIPMGEPCLSQEMALQTLTAVSATSKNPEKAVKLLELINTDKEIYQLLIHGIEGKHYEKLDSGHIRAISEDYGYHTSGWYFGNQFNSLVVEGKDIDIWEQMAEVNEKSQISALYGLTIDTTSITNEIANISAIISEFKGLRNGTADPDATLKAFADKMESAGIDKVVVEAQRQIDEYLKK